MGVVVWYRKVVRMCRRMKGVVMFYALDFFEIGGLFRGEGGLLVGLAEFEKGLCVFDEKPLLRGTGSCLDRDRGVAMLWDVEVDC